MSLYATIRKPIFDGYPPAFAQVQGPVIVNPGGKVTYLRNLGGADSRATGINDAGQVVGYSTTSFGSTHAFITGPNGMG